MHRSDHLMKFCAVSAAVTGVLMVAAFVLMERLDEGQEPLLGLLTWLETNPVVGIVFGGALMLAGGVTFSLFLVACQTRCGEGLSRGFEVGMKEHGQRR